MSQKGFAPLLILLGVTIIIGIIGGVYYFSKSRIIQPQSQNPVDTSLIPRSTISSTSVSESTPTTQISEEVKIIDGSVYRVSAIGKKELLLDKQNYQDKGVSNFIEVSLSPDKSNVLLFAQGGISIPFLYYTPLFKINMQYIDITQEAVWSHNSRYIAYINGPAEALTNSEIHIYDTTLNKKIDISNKPTIKNLSYDYLTFTNISWSEDDSGIKVHYIARGGEAPRGETLGEGDIILPLVTEK